MATPHNPYLNRLTSQHARRPNFRATVDAWTRLSIDLQRALKTGLSRAFDLDTATGVQLDQVGEWVGRTRSLRLPIEDVYFAWETDKVGWNEGVWKGLYDPAGGITRLPDDFYRMLLKAKVAANQWDGTRDGAYAVWEEAFAPESSIESSILFIQDFQDMTIAVGVAGAPPSPVLEALLTQGYIPLKPEGVRVSFYALPPSGSTGALFAWDCESNALGGWDTGSWARLFYPEMMEDTHAA